MAPKSCRHCGEPTTELRRQYHAECLPLVRAAAATGPITCSRCHESKLGGEFSTDLNRVNGKYPWCMSCQLAYRNTIRVQNPEAKLNGHTCPLCSTPIRGRTNRRFCSLKCLDKAKALRTRFGLSPEQYLSLVTANQGVCPVCTQPCDEWHVDHNHSTGEVTGVVCQKCNIGPLAYTYHDPAFVRRLLHYLENPIAAQVGVTATGTCEIRSSNLHSMWRRGAYVKIADR
jgi:hypothetical protein